MPKTMYYQCHDANPTHLPTYMWRPWVNCKEEETELTRRMVVHRFLQDRGGLTGDHMTVYLFEHSEDAPRHDNGTPVTVTSVEYEVSKGERL